MSRLSPPRVVGVAGGVGTTTVATALRAHDRGRELGDGTEVLACRCTGDSLLQAASTVSLLAAQGRVRPVLAVTADQPAPPRGPLRARLRMIEPQVSGLVILPYVARWRELSDPLTEVAGLIDAPPDQLPKALRDYLTAVRMLAGAVLRSGQLAQDEPPPQPNRPPDQAEPQPRSAGYAASRRYVAYRLPPDDRHDAEPQVATNGEHR